MPEIAHNIKHLRERIAHVAGACGRQASDVTLLAVSKTQPAAAIRAAHAAGLRAFGENYVQEALGKIAELADCAIAWHFIGPIQSNKTRPLAEQFAWVHSIDRLKIATRLSEQRPPGMAALNVCIQVNIDDEASKAGVAPGDVAALAAAIAELPNLRLRGLMAIPAPEADIEKQRAPFFRLRQLLDTLKAAPALRHLDTLSMGMSADLEAAISEGATIIRVGTAIFGERQ
ncbi:MAG: YggS family pyridoxal phosphate-dependent enzyme [Porticoccaceae bacterium]